MLPTRKLPIEDIVAGAAAYQGRMAVITGGEPLLHNLEELTFELHEAGFQTNIETSGSSPVSGNGTGFVFRLKNLKRRLPKIFRWQMN